MEIKINSHGLYAHFEVSEAGKLYLLYLGNRPEGPAVPEEKKKWYNASEIQITGKNQDDHHGAKHSGSSGVQSLRYVSHSLTENKLGQKLEFLLKDDEIEATLHYQFYRDISVVRSWTVVKNVSNANVGLDYVSSFSLTGIEEDTADADLRVLIPHNYWLREANWKCSTLSQLGLNRADGFSMKRIACSNIGTWSTKEYLPMGAFQRNGSMLMWQIEQNGSWHWEISDLSNRLYLRLSGPTESDTGWHKELKPGEAFESVKAAVVVAEEFNSAISEMTGYRRQIVKQFAGNKGMPVIFNDYMNCLGADPTTEKEIPVIDRAAEAGAEYYVMDAGWYADGTWWETVGEWMPCEWRFPNGGLKAVFDYIHSKNMIPGIWLEIEVMGINCPILDQFEDDCFFMRHGRRIIDHGRYHLDFSNPKVRRFATGVVDRLVAEYGVGYIKMDYNIDGGLGTEVNADSFGDGLLRHNRAYLSWIDEINEKYPHLIIENCSSGGLRMDYAMLAHHGIQSLTDQTSCIEMTHISQAAATAVIPEQAAIWAYPIAADSEDLVALNMVNAMGLRIHLSGEIMKLNDRQFALVQEGVRCYKENRDAIEQSVCFYPAGLPNYDDKIFCVGYKSPEKTYLSVWRLDSEEETLTVPVDGSKAKVLYPSGGNCTVSGDANSLSVTLPAQNSAAFIEL